LDPLGCAATVLEHYRVGAETTEAPLQVQPVDVRSGAGQCSFGFPDPGLIKTQLIIEAELGASAPAPDLTFILRSQRTSPAPEPR
jgi:hypothetical protein